MVTRVFITCAICMPILFSCTGRAQPGGRYLDIKGQILDAVFLLEVDPKPYFSKMVLRFGDSVTQLTIVVYPGSRSEMLSFQLADMDGERLDRLIAKAVADNPQVKPHEIAAKLKANVTRTSIDYAVLSRSIEDLKSVRISPVLDSRIAVDEFSTYEFWYDTWQESVHYTIVGPFKGEPQDELVKWMLKFRTTAASWAKG